MNEENQTYDVYYDKVGDFLEITFGEPAEEGTTEEIEEGIFITKDIETKEVKNVGILSFRKRVMILKKILKQYNLTLPLEIGISH
jgi:uncharacterized protein YuzE